MHDSHGMGMGGYPEGGCTTVTVWHRGMQGVLMPRGTLVSGTGYVQATGGLLMVSIQGVVQVAQVARVVQVVQVVQVVVAASRGHHKGH